MSSYIGFDQLKSQLAHRPGVTNPAGLAAAVGRRKYGAPAMRHAAKTGHSLKGHRPAKKRSGREEKIAMFVRGRS